MNAEIAIPSQQSPAYICAATTDTNPTDYDVIKEKILSYTQSLPTYEEIVSLSKNELCILASELGDSFKRIKEKVHVIIMYVIGRITIIKNISSSASYKRIIHHSLKRF